MAKIKAADRVRTLFNSSNSSVRWQWKKVNQKGYEYANDNQLSEDDKKNLEEQGMPTFTINRISPVVEMLNFYATANNPRWQAIGKEGSDSGVAAVFSDLAEYVWQLSDGDTLYSNVVNNCITKSLGYMLIDIDADMDNGMGEVVIKQPEPFDVYVDPKSRDILFRDASFILIRKILPKSHLIKLFPEYDKKIKKASSEHMSYESASFRSLDDETHDFYQDDNDILSIDPEEGHEEEVQEYFELYERIKVPFINVFYRMMPNKEQLKQMAEQAKVKMKEMSSEMQVKLMEQKQEMEKAVQAGKMLPERFELEINKVSQQMTQQLQSFEQQYMSKLQQDASKVENKVVSEKEFKILQKDPTFASMIVDTIKFHDTRLKQTCVVGDTFLYEKVYPQVVKDYPVIPYHFKWTGTPMPMSAVSPLIGKQTEINKSHQIMVHNASLGSSLRWIYDEGSIDTEIWEKYSSSPGALLPKRQGQDAPQPIQPMPLSNAFFTMVQEGKSDMEYLSGIYSSMQGNTQQQHETFRGMLAMDEYGTRRVKQWMKHSIEPALRQTGRVIMQFCQATYSANKRFRIIQPSALQETREQEINIPIYNDMGNAIGKSMDVQTMKADITVVAGSTLPVNRWAYLAELKDLLKVGVIDDIAVLAETDVKNKEQVAERKSMMAQLQGQLQQIQEAVKDRDGTIETLSRQLVQAGIKSKVIQAEMEITKKKEQVKGGMNKQFIQTEGEQKLLRSTMQNEAATKGKELNMAVNMAKNDLQEDEKEQ
tara:strand:- start:14693 stop:16987 length:2295 start_codon:yes stop_codon:yes gene_type:complete